MASATEIAPDNAIADISLAAYGRAEIAIAQEQWNAAARDLNAALPHRRDSALVHNLLNKTYAALGEDELAREHALVAASLATETAIRADSPPASDER